MTNYYYCDVCDKTSEQEHCKVTINDQLICPHCLEAVEFAFSVCTDDNQEPSLGFCDGCDELEAKLHLVDGDWICDKCKAAVIAVKENKAKAQTMRSIAIDTCHYSEDDLEGEDHWEMTKASVFIILFIIWACFALWGKYVS